MDKGYNGALWVAPKLVGLADYSNFNYFSDDTVFSSKYAYPSRSESVPYVSDVTGIVIPPGGIPYTDRVVYFRGWTSDSIEVPHLAAADLLYWEWSILQPWEQTEVAAHLDENCYQDYASNLVPRAVSYGMALVNYFFRAKFDVTAVGDQLTVTNKSTGRAKGSITVYADTADGTRTKVPEFEGMALNNGAAMAVDSTWTVSGFPGTEGITYTFVFDGTVENTGAITVEDRAIAGRVFTWTPPAELDRHVYDVGSNPMGLAVTSDGARVLVANYSDDTVSVLDARGTDVIATLTVGDGPYDIAIAGGYAFVSNERGSSISVINLADLTVAKTFTGLPAYPREIAATTDGRAVYCAHWSGGWQTLSKIDVSSMTIALLNADLDFQKMMTGIALHPSRPRGYALYYAYFWRKSVAVFDTDTDDKIADIPGPDLNRSGAVEAGGAYLYYVSRYLDQVSRLDTSTNTHLLPALQLEAGSNPMRVSAGSDGQVYISSYGVNKVQVLNGATGALGTAISDADLSNPVEAVASPDNAVLYVSSSGNNKVLRLPLQTQVQGTLNMAASFSVMGAESAAAPTSALTLSGVPYEADIRLDERYAPQEAYAEDGAHLLSGLPTGWHTLEIVAPGYLPWSQQVLLMEGENLLSPVLDVE
jgi:YVTN family beta-propeller protein